MSLQETILLATQPPAGAGAGSLVLHDIQTGAALTNWKQTSAGARCNALVPGSSSGHLGGALLSAQPDKAFLNVYTFQKDQIALKTVLPERLTCLAADTRGLLCAGGTAQGRIYLWELASGIMCHSWEAHYRAVSVLRFTPDGNALVSGSEDAGVSVWSISRLLDEDAQNGAPTPVANLGDHTLPITDIACGMGVFPNCRILTASVDHSVKLWDLATQTLLTSWLLPAPIAHLVWDPTERLFFAAAEGAKGDVYQVNMFRRRDDGRGEAVGGAGVADIIRISDDEAKESSKRIINVGEPVSALALSLTASLLLVGTAPGLVHVYDVRSHQLLRTISVHKGARITHLEAISKPPDLVGHVSLVRAANNEAPQPRPIVALQRTRDVSSRTRRDVSVVLAARPKDTMESITSYDADELLSDHAFFVQPAPLAPTENTPVPAATSARVSELEDEVTKLRAQLAKAKSVNDAMWENVVTRAVRERPGVVPAVEESERARKRGRT
ncbi:WD40 repeat-like protein [Peniophora sp. CONT]|nr:WD40 repeat-like protein [Peniophora sp. CONT]